MNLPLFEPEVKANQERAEESLQAAQLLYEAGHWDFAAARAYYAAFYAATATLLSEGREYQKHSGVCERKSNREPLVAVQKGPTWFKK